MVDAVHLLETETTSWREIIEWPKLDPRFEPENDTVVFVTDPTYPGKSIKEYGMFLSDNFLEKSQSYFKNPEI